MVSGDCDPVHVLPCLLQVYPDIEILHEEDVFSPRAERDHATAHASSRQRTSGESSQPGRARWVMAGKRLYLLVRGRGLVYHPNPVVALASHVAWRARHH